MLPRSRYRAQLLTVGTRPRHPAVRRGVIPTVLQHEQFRGAPRGNQPFRGTNNMRRLGITRAAPARTDSDPASQTTWSEYGRGTFMSEQHHINFSGSVDVESPLDRPCATTPVVAHELAQAGAFRWRATPLPHRQSMCSRESRGQQRADGGPHGVNWSQRPPARFAVRQ